MRKVELRPRALYDIDSVFTYLAVVQKSPEMARRIKSEIIGMIKEVAEFPEMGRVFFEKNKETDYRRIRSSKYWIYYSFDEQNLIVWRIIHTSRDMDEFGFDDFE